MTRSRFFGSAVPKRPHVLSGGGVGAEVRDLREDVEKAFEMVEESLAPIAFDSALPALTWLSPYQIAISAVRGQPPTIRATLPDAVVRTTTSPQTFDVTFVGPGGLDVGAEAPNTLYYVYFVPGTVDPTKLEVRGSINHPAVGPTGFPVFEYLGCVRNDVAGDFILSGGTLVI